MTNVGHFPDKNHYLHFSSTFDQLGCKRLNFVSYPFVYRRSYMFLASIWSNLRSRRIKGREWVKRKRIFPPPLLRLFSRILFFLPHPLPFIRLLRRLIWSGLCRSMFWLFVILVVLDSNVAVFAQLC